MATLKAKLQGWAEQHAAARDALREIGDIDRGLREERAAVVKERARLASASPPVEEIVANLERVIDSHAASKPAEDAYSLRRAFGGELEMRNDGRLVERKPAMPRWFYTSDELTVARLCALFPELVKARFAEILRAVPYEAGAPMADRLRLLEAADARIAEIEARHTELVDYARSLEPPVTLTLLPAVQARRETELRKAERERLQREARERIEQQVNAEVTPRAVPSPYLRANAPDRRPL